LPEVVGDAGLLIPPEDQDRWRTALIQVVGDAALRAELIARGRARAAEFSLERFASETLAVYREAAG
jgi:glycosyltransferase involved in cell wall biosynthesis